jgi:hypothetical protein
MNFRPRSNAHDNLPFGDHLLCYEPRQITPTGSVVEQHGGDASPGQAGRHNANGRLDNLPVASSAATPDDSPYMRDREQAKERAVMIR